MKIIVPPSLYEKLKKEGYDMRWYVKSKLIKLEGEKHEKRMDTKRSN